MERITWKELRAAGGLAGLQKKARARQLENRGDDGLNKTERRYVDQVARPRQLAGEIEGFEAPCPLKLRLGSDWKTSFEPDVLVMELDGTLTFVDAKAGQAVKREDGTVYYRPLSHDDAKAKIKVAAARFPIFRFVEAWEEPSGWKERVVE